MHVSHVKHSYAWLPRKCDYWTDTHKDGRTDRRRTKWSLCTAILCRQHKNIVFFKYQYMYKKMLKLMLCIEKRRTSPNSLELWFLPPHTEFFMHFLSNSQCCLSLVVFTYLVSLPTSGKTALLEWIPCDVINHAMTWRQDLHQFAWFSNQKAFWSSFWKQKGGFCYGDGEW